MRRIDKSCRTDQQGEADHAFLDIVYFRSLDRGIFESGASRVPGETDYLDRRRTSGRGGRSGRTAVCETSFRIAEAKCRHRKPGWGGWHDCRRGHGTSGGGRLYASSLVERYSWHSPSRLLEYRLRSIQGFLAHWSDC